jgi:hypothetical protein
MSACLALLAACGDPHPDLIEKAVRTGPPAPLSVVSANVICTDCPDATALRPAWLRDMLMRRDADVLMVQGLQTRDEKEAIDAALPEYDSFYIGREDTAPLEYFEAVTWLRRDGFKLDARTYYYFLTPDRTPNTRFPEAQELRAVVGAAFRDCRSDLHYTWENVVLESTPGAQQRSLDVIAFSTWYSNYAVALGGAFGMSANDPLYPTLLSPPGSTATPTNTVDLAEIRDTSAAPNLDLGTLTDHVLVGLRYVRWTVPQWTLEANDYGGKRIVDHPPIWVVILEGEPPHESTVVERESCRRGAVGGS